MSFTSSEKDAGVVLRKGMYVNIIKGGRLMTPIECAVLWLTYVLPVISLVWAYSVLAYVFFYRSWVTTEHEPAIAIWNLGALTSCFQMSYIAVIQQYTKSVILDNQRISQVKEIVITLTSIGYIVFVGHMYGMFAYWVIYKALVLPSDDPWKEMFYRMIEFNIMNLGALLFTIPFCFFDTPVLETVDEV